MTSFFFETKQQPAFGNSISLRRKTWAGELGINFSLPLREAIFGVVLPRRHSREHSEARGQRIRVR